jgi:hypothetical protein
MSEWGNPASLCKQMASPADECIVRVGPTQGTETSQYLEERKSTETPSVAASESGRAQTGPVSGSGLWASHMEVTKASLAEGSWKGPGIEGDTPVRESESPPERYQSSVELVELCVKPGGPPSKAKYSSTTDSEQVG